MNYINKIHILNLFLSFFINSISAVYNGKCSTGNGVCVSVDSCAYFGGTTSNGLCPGDPKNVKCCNKNCVVDGTVGKCMFKNQCKGSTYTGFCPGGNDFVCCIPQKNNIFQCPTMRNNQDTLSGKSKFSEAIVEIRGNEGGCQNNKSDQGNYIDGKLGYTCGGITPSVGWANKSYFYYALSKCTDKTLFVKCAYDLDKEKFLISAQNIYEDKYVKTGGCSDIPQPAYYVCLDMSINAGPNWPKQTIRRHPIGSKDGKEYGFLLNNLSREYYKNIVRRDPSKKVFLNGWLNRAQRRENYCNNYCTSAHSLAETNSENINEIDYEKDIQFENLYINDYYNNYEPEETEEPKEPEIPENPEEPEIPGNPENPEIPDKPKSNSKYMYYTLLNIFLIAIIFVAYKYKLIQIISNRRGYIRL